MKHASELIKDFESEQYNELLTDIYVDEHLLAGNAVEQGEQRRIRMADISPLFRNSSKISETQRYLSSPLRVEVK